MRKTLMSFWECQWQGQVFPFSSTATDKNLQRRNGHMV